MQRYSIYTSSVNIEIIRIPDKRFVTNYHCKSAAAVLDEFVIDIRVVTIILLLVLRLIKPNQRAKSILCGRRDRLHTVLFVLWRSRARAISAISSLLINIIIIAHTSSGAIHFLAIERLALVTRLASKQNAIYITTTADCCTDTLRIFRSLHNRVIIILARAQNLLFHMHIRNN